MAELTVLDVTTPDFALTVFPLGHKDIDGLVGMGTQAATCKHRSRRETAPTGA